MGCPFHGTGGEGGTEEDAADAAPKSGDQRGGVDRREFLQSALVIGGTSALSTITGLYGVPEVAAGDDHEPISVTARRNRQHAWDAFETLVESRQQTVPPAHHLLLHVDYDHEGMPTPGHRQSVAEALREVERTYEWSHEGVMFTVGYSTAYFDRFDEPLPPGIEPAPGTSKPALISAGTLIEAEGVTLDREDPTADAYDAVIHLASDHPEKLLAVEAALWDESGESVPSFDATLEGVFTKPETYPARRVGFAGHEALEERGGEEEADGVYPSTIPENAELSMGFNDQYRNSIPRETDVTLIEDQQLVTPKPPGVFSQGTIQHVSKLDLNLAADAGQREGGWYDDHDLDERRQQMFSPEHTAENTGEVGEQLDNTNAPANRAAPDGTPMRDLSDEATADVAERTEDHAADENRVGHAQKTARARFDIQNRLTEEGVERLSTPDDADVTLPADEASNTLGTAAQPYDADLPGHDGEQEAEQVMLRRDVDTVDQSTPGNHFVALMRFAPYMVYMRRAMNGVEFSTAQFGLDPDGEGLEHDGDVPSENDGILDYLTTQRRGNYLVPPITLRALPHPRGRHVDVAVEWDAGGDAFVVELDDRRDMRIDTDTARFGWFYDVNRGAGVRPSAVRRKGGALTFTFPVDGAGIDTAPGGPDGDDDVRLRLFAKESGSRRPVWGTANLQNVAGRD